MKKKLTLNQTWILCLRMWRWIAKVWQTPRYRRYKVYQLKAIWCRKNGLHHAQHDCFFCDYTMRGTQYCEDCTKCPGNLVSSNFDCTNDDYYYSIYPVEFYKELLWLNRIRKAKK